MPDKDALHSVIRKVDRAEAVDSSYQDRVERGPIWKRVYYLVSHNNTGQAAASGQTIVPVKATENSWCLYLLVDYRATTASALSGRSVAERLVDAVGEKQPQEFLEQRIRDLVGHYVATNGGASSFIRDFDRLQTGLKSQIKTTIEDTVGLSLGLTITPSTNGKPLEKMRLIDKDLTFYVQDYSSSVTCRLSLVLEALNSVWPYIYCDSLDHQADQITEATESFLKKLTLQQVVCEMEATRRRLVDELEKIARPYGRTVARLGLEYHGSIPRPRTVERITLDTITFPNLLEYPEPVNAHCEFQLHLQSLGAYAERKSPDLKEWAAVAMRQALLKKLLDVPYVDLFLGTGTREQFGFGVYNRKLEETRALVRREAELIGYAIPGHISIRTDLQFIELRDGFSLEIKDEFETKVAGYPVGLEANVFAKITDENTIRDLFNQGVNVDIKKIIRSAVLDEIKKHLRKISPEKYYTHFEGNDETGTTPVMDSLKEAVKALLVGDLYKATEIDVTCRQSPTDLSRLFDELRKEEREIQVSDERSGLSFTGVYRVHSLSKKYWDEFQSQRPSPDKVQSIVNHLVQQWLLSFGRDRLMQTGDNKRLAQLNIDVGLQDLPRELGVCVNFIRFARKRTSGEDHFLEHVQHGIAQGLDTSENIKEQEASILLSSLAELEKRRVIAIREDDFGLLAQIDKEIQQTKNRWSNHGEDIPLAALGEAARRGYSNEINGLKALTSGVPLQEAPVSAGHGRTKGNLPTKADNQESESS